MPLRIRIRLPRAARPPRRPDAVPVRFASDAVRLEEPPPETQEEESRRRLRRLALLAAPVAIFAAGGALAIFGQGGWLDLRAAQAQEADLQRRSQAQLEKVLQLKAVNVRLQNDPRVVERIAREQLGYAGEGEVLFLLPDDPGQPAEEPDLGRGLPRPRVVEEDEAR